MGQINILDTGYISTDNSGTQASSGLRANSGSVISLKTAEFVPSLKRNLQTDPDLGTNTPSEVNQGTLENMRFVLKCILQKKESTDMNKIQHLLDLVATDGYKLMWYQYSNATTELNNGQLIFQIANNDLFGHQLESAETTAFSISDTFYHLHVLFENIEPRETGDNRVIRYDLKGIVLPVKDSVLT